MVAVLSCRDWAICGDGVLPQANQDAADYRCCHLRAAATAQGGPIAVPKVSGRPCAPCTAPQHVVRGMGAFLSTTQGSGSAFGCLQCLHQICTTMLHLALSFPCTSGAAKPLRCSFSHVCEAPACLMCWGCLGRS